MSRKPREHSDSGIYHAMLRGINQQVIFEDDEDYEKFLDVLQECKRISNFKLYAYCLMSNHVHLLLHCDQGSESLEQVFKRIGVRYVSWYNRKYGRFGHLFQDRFRSEAVNDDSYFWSVLPYIHQNPVKAGLCKKPEHYGWSSYSSYLSGKGICNTVKVLEMLSADLAQSISTFKDIHKKEIQAICMDFEEERRLSDMEVRVLLGKLCGTDKATVLQALPVSMRDAAIAVLKEQGASLRQIVRLTGWTFGIVRSR